MLTEPGELIIDPFAGSCVTGEVAERLNRNWICAELREDYVDGAKGRFIEGVEKPSVLNGNTEKFYKLARPGLLWNGIDDVPLPKDGGKKRSLNPSKVALEGSARNGRQADEAKTIKEKVKTKASEGQQDRLL